MKPMLAEPGDPSRLKRFCTEDKWVVQQKLDGHRVLIHVEDGKVTSLGRDGLPKKNAIPAAIVREFEAFTDGDWFFDGELVGNTYWLFDLPQVSNYVATTDTWEFRNSVLGTFYHKWNPDARHIRLLPTVEGDEKAEFVLKVHDEDGEGVIFKDRDSTYCPGKRTARFTKIKFTQDVDCKVTKIKTSGKDNITVALLNTDSEWVDVAEVTALAGDGGKIAVGDVVTVKYLYAMWRDPKHPRLYQPTLPRIRDDKPVDECTFDQLRFTDRLHVVEF